MEMIAERYKIEYLAGSGGFGSLYKGYDVRMERNVAIKQENIIEDREARLLKRMDHRGLPRLYDICRDDGKTYVVMEWIPGMNLEEYMDKNGALEETKAVGIGMELLEILKYLHGLKPPVIYQDLKPSNIMLMPNGHIKLVDFGTAFSLKFNDERIVSAGTVGYSSPEQRGIHGPQFADERSDIYSWGACMYSLVSGRSLSKPPYTMDKPRRSCPELSHGLEKIILKATHRNPEKRYKNAAMVESALDNSGLVDAMYKLIWSISMIISVAPFVLAWIGGCRDELFVCIEKVFAYCGNMSFREGLLPGIYLFVKSLFSVGVWTREGCITDIQLKALGRLILALAWMVGGFKILSMGRSVKVRRSVFLTEKRYPGVGVWMLVLGIVFGYMVSGIVGMPVVNAAESGDVLPVSVVDGNGMKTVVRYDAVYSPNGDMRLEIPREALEGEKEKLLTVSLRTDEGKVAARTFILK